MPNLSSKSLIIMDNTKYHLSFLNHVHKTKKKKKKDCVDYLQSKGLTVEAKIMLTILHKCVYQYIKVHELLACVRLAEVEGYKVLFTPPYHSNF